MGLHYITAISKPQIETLLAAGTLQMELFDQPLGEVIVPSAVPQPPDAAASPMERYKSLSEVEQAFRRGKTIELEMRPVHVCKEERTRGHFLVVMLAYQIMKELGRRWARLDITVEDGIKRLNTYCAIEVAGVLSVLPEPRADVKELLAAARVTLPTQLPSASPKVATRKKLPDRRPSRKK